MLSLCYKNRRALSLSDITMIKNAFRAAAFSLLIIAPSIPAIAETRCEVKTHICTDVKSGPRTCQTTICKNEKGEVQSIDTIVLKDGTVKGNPRSPQSKTQLPERSTTIKK